MKSNVHFSISTKLKAIIVTVTSFILIIATIFIILNQYDILQKDLTYNSVLNSKIIGYFCASSILFDEKDVCTDILKKSSEIDYIVDITIYDTTGTQFAAIHKRTSSNTSFRYIKPELTDTTYYEENLLNVVKKIVYNNIPYGYIHLRSSYSYVNNKILNYALTMSILLIITILIAYFMASNLQKIISKPILKLAKLSNEISRSGNYNQIIEVKSRDEIGILYKEFGNMLSEINQRKNERDAREQVIRQLNEELEQKVEYRTHELQLEKEKTQHLLEISDQLLLNILPEPIANRLKKGETTIADQYEDASVVFIDIVDFSKTSADSDPKRVVEVLNILYTKLDLLAYKHGLEKIKTIGDCYMAAAGVPIANKENAIMAANFAIEAMNLIENYDTGDGTIINFRCGIDGGPLVAGIIGENKFIYDLWGDTVNTAARMEKCGIAGKIHCSPRFKNKLEYTIESNNSGHKFKFVERGEISLKGIGKMNTFFLERKSDSGIKL